MTNKQERIKAASELFADHKAEAYIANQSVIDIVAEVEEIGITTHDERFGDLRNNSPTLDKCYNYLVEPESNK